MSSPFEFVTSINSTKKYILEDEKDYKAFLVNRSLSYFPDTALMANEMNIHHQLDPKLQYDFLINIVRKKKRFSKWAKAETLNDIDSVKEYYGYSNEKAKSALLLLTNEQIELIKTRIYKGGTTRK